MGKTLANLFNLSKGNSNKQRSKLKTLLSLAGSRLTILKNHHQARSKLARGDVDQLLQLGHLDRALLRAELVVKEENLLDVFAIIQSYCHLVAERAMLLLQPQNGRECPPELKEAISSLIYVSSRSGEMPELMHVCKLFSSMFGREFVSAATELRNCCGVNTKIVQKLSTKQPSLESRIRIVKEIAAEKGIALDPSFEVDPFYTSSITQKATSDSSNNRTQVQPTIKNTNINSNSNHNYKDVASAAQAACEKAEDAAAAARAAIELSRSSQSPDNKRNEDENYSSESEDEGNHTDDDGGIKNKFFMDDFDTFTSTEASTKIEEQREFELSFKSSMEDDSETAGLFDSADGYNNTKSECEETAVADNVSKSLEKVQKVTRQAVSVRTRHSMFK